MLVADVALDQPANGDGFPDLQSLYRLLVEHAGFK